MSEYIPTSDKRYQDIRESLTQSLNTLNQFRNLSNNALSTLDIQFGIIAHHFSRFPHNARPVLASESLAVVNEMEQYREQLNTLAHLLLTNAGAIVQCLHGHNQLKDAVKDEVLRLPKLLKGPEVFYAY